ncbi:MAG TPA: serine hydrolase domain-containing protein, partial [Blastocatellia bacterium]|nr:serine hydrolase domain-containing protein [Blastocatellia bacterium]
MNSRTVKSLRAVRSRRSYSRREVIALGASAICASLLPSPAFARTPQRKAKWAKLDWADVESRIKATIDNGTFDGAGLLLCTAEGTFYKKAFGADTTETTHLLASATKLASTTAIMTLVDDKLIKLDDPIRKYLPQFGSVRGAIT